MTDNFSFLLEKHNDDFSDSFEYIEEDIPCISMTFSEQEVLIPSDDLIPKTDDLGIIQNKSISKYILK
jgi:hypothetical protein